MTNPTTELEHAGFARLLIADVLSVHRHNVARAEKRLEDARREVAAAEAELEAARNAFDEAKRFIARHTQKRRASVSTHCG